MSKNKDFMDRIIFFLLFITIITIAALYDYNLKIKNKNNIPRTEFYENKK